ncbi:phosphate signaling complex protein PhoU [Anaeromicropila herbilytica]|uniref:Phosphate-specific transport system accessory protein PhoU n=1 Tax=Anaeromicropila herbilytica TaxID=2785025 RepID=A0A7R7ENQ7_9FIRM|nr:phosphate signaling complex protein PhoU [Anaeromicropila herbilytica]BCN32320.1 phosphate transport system regulatory protein PhoU [Anaeromicropila herbilytica]
MTRQVFIKELEVLHNDVIKMGSVLELSLNEMIVALQDMDVELAQKIIDRDDEIDLLEQQIEKECINIIAKQQPIASDLRKVTSIMKIITDIERIADHCADISEYLMQIHKQPTMKAPEHLSDMIQVMKKMVVDTIDSFVNQDADKAASVIAQDDIVDNYFTSISKELCDMMQKDIKVIPQCVAYIMIIKYIERMGDHSTNIAEWIQFIVTGKLVLS